MSEPVSSPQDEIRALVASLLLRSEFKGSNETLAAGGTLIKLHTGLSDALNSKELSKNGLVQQLVRLEMAALESVIDCSPSTHQNAVSSLRDGLLPTSLSSEHLFHQVRFELAA